MTNTDEHDVTVWFGGVVRVSHDERRAANWDLRRAAQNVVSRARVTGVLDARPEPARRGEAT